MHDQRSQHPCNRREQRRFVHQQLHTGRAPALSLRSVFAKCAPRFTRPAVRTEPLLPVILCRTSCQVAIALGSRRFRPRSSPRGRSTTLCPPSCTPSQATGWAISCSRTSTLMVNSLLVTQPPTRIATQQCGQRSERWSCMFGPSVLLGTLTADTHGGQARSRARAAIRGVNVGPPRGVRITRGP